MRLRRTLRRAALLYLILAVLALLSGVVAASAQASTGNAVNQLADIPVAVWAAMISANAIPYLSALATDHPGWWTGAITVALSLVGAVLTALAQGGNQDWRWVAAVTAVMWVIARLHLGTFVKGTDAESLLHRTGAHLGRRPASQVSS